MSKNYTAFFGLTKEPFISDIPINEILVTNEIKAVFERFNYAMRLGAVALITGDVGSGKSTAIRWTIKQLSSSETKILRITASSGSILEFYRQLLSELGANISSQSKALLTKAIRECVFDLIVEKRKKPVIVIDEASLLELQVFVELHTITQFEYDSKPWLPIVLVGQNQIIDKLRFRLSTPLASRVVARSHLSSIEREDMDIYLSHHLKVAGVTGNLFKEETKTAILQGSGGIYRKANHLARGSLIAAFKKQSSVVLPEHVKLAGSEIF